MSAHPIVLVGGGVRSGKSRFALRRVSALGPRCAFVATAQAFDDEMRDRIRRHQAERDARFHTIEAPTALVPALEALPSGEPALIDCLTLWLSNLLLADLDEAALDAEVETLAAYLERRERPLVLVTNEVGMGVVPPHPLGRRFRDVAGTTHQRIAAVADEVYLAAMGLVLRLSPAPVEAIAP